MFFKEMLNKFGLAEQVSDFCIVNFANSAVCILGNVKILHLSKTKIILMLKKEKVYIYGNDLQLVNLEKNEINILGQIVATSKKEILLNE